MPQPIDPSSELGRITAAERVQMTMERAAQMAQLRSAEEGAQDSARVQEQVRQADQKEQHVDKELKRRNPYLMLKKKKKQGEGDVEEESLDTYNARQRLEHPDGDEHRLDVIL